MTKMLDVDQEIPAPVSSQDFFFTSNDPKFDPAVSRVRARKQHLELTVVMFLGIKFPMPNDEVDVTIGGLQFNYKLLGFPEVEYYLDATSSQDIAILKLTYECEPGEIEYVG